MNVYEVLVIENGVTRTIRLIGVDISHIINYVQLNSIVKIELVGTDVVEDRTGA